MAKPRGYSSYHGKGYKGKIALAIFLVLVIVASVAVIRLQKYIVYDDSGDPRLELPKAEQKTLATSENGDLTNTPVTPNLTIQEPEQKKIQARALAVAPLSDWQSIWTKASSEGTAFNAVAYTVKDKDGHVYFDSQVAPSSALKTAEGTGAAIGGMLGQEQLHTIARLACFRDAIASSDDLEGVGLKNLGGYSFYDGNNDRWLDPSKPAARQYLCKLAVECAEMGFDEILLTDVTFPTEGKIQKIDYGTGTDRSLSLASFLKELRTALAKYEVTISIELPLADLTSAAPKTAEASGLSVDVMVPLVDRVYAQTDDQKTAEVFSSKVTAVNKKADFIPEGTAARLGTDSYLVFNDQ